MERNSNNSRNDNQNQQRQQKMSSQLTLSVTEQLVSKLVGMNMSLIYSLENLEADIPQAQGLGGRQLGEAKWKINGKIVITTETHNARGGA